MSDSLPTRTFEKNLFLSLTAYSLSSASLYALKPLINKSFKFYLKIRASKFMSVAIDLVLSYTHHYLLSSLLADPYQF